MSVKYPSCCSSSLRAVPPADGSKEARRVWCGESATAASNGRSRARSKTIDTRSKLRRGIALPCGSKRDKPRLFRQQRLEFVERVDGDAARAEAAGEAVDGFVRIRVGAEGGET